MKLKKFLKLFNEYTTTIEVNEEKNEVFEELYTGEIFNIPKKLLNYKIDSDKNVCIDTRYFPARNYTKLIIYVREAEQF